MSTQDLRRQTASTAREVVWSWLRFATWFIVGIGYAISLVGPAWTRLSILLPLLATVLLAQRQPARRGLPGLISGLGVSSIYIAYLNRSGPALVCTSTAGGGQACDSQVSPWPWLAAGLILTVVGIAAVLLWPRYTLRRQIQGK